MIQYRNVTSCCIMIIEDGDSFPFSLKVLFESVALLFETRIILPEKVKIAEEQKSGLYWGTGGVECFSLISSLV